MLQVALRGDLLFRGGAEPFDSFLALRSAAMTARVDVGTVITNYLIFSVQNRALYVDYPRSRIVTHHWLPCRNMLVLDVSVLLFLEVVAGKTHITDILRTALRGFCDFDVFWFSERTLTSFDVDPAGYDFSIEQQSLPIFYIIFESSD